MSAAALEERICSFMFNDSFIISAEVSGSVEHAVSLKQILQHMEACPELAHYGLCGIRKWSGRGFTGQGL